MSNQIVISSGAKVRSLEGVLTGTAGIVNSVPLGGANGVATLDSNGKVPLSQLPASVVTYLGTWNAATNTPTLANGTGDVGDLYICNVAGTVNFGAGPITFAVGDWVIYNGSEWQKSSGASGTVTSVAVTESGDALTITGSPITTAGTINIGFAGNSGQYINGEGNLTTFPSLITEAQNLVTEVYNETGATLTKGTVVYINGGHGNLPTITKAIATSDATSAQTYGVVRADISNNNNGYVTVIGNLDNMDTQAYPAGTQLYLSSTTAGAYTSVKQYAPAHLVYVGIVVRSHPTQGVIEVRIQNGFELDELHNVSAQTPSNNDGLFYNSSNSLWENKSIATALGYTPANAATYVPYTGATTDVNLGYRSISASNINIDGYSFGDGGAINFKQFTSLSLAGTGYTSIGANSTNILTFGFNQGSLNLKGFKLDVAGLTTNVWRTYTMPNADGTLALTSDIPSLSGYVPYTGATSAVDLGNNNFSSYNVNVNGDNSTYGGILNFRQANTVSGPGSLGYTSINALGKTSLWFYYNISSGVSKAFNLSSYNLTNNVPRTYTMPDADGTIALTSDIPSLANYVTLTGTQTITGVKTFSNEQLFSNGLTINGGYLTFADSGFSSTLDTTTLTASRAILLPNASGTIALTSDIPSLSGYVQGSGTTNYLPKFTGASTIGNSAIQDSGTLVTMTSPTDIVTGSGIGSSGVAGLLRVVTAGTSSAIAIGQANSSRYTSIQANEYITYNDDMSFRTFGSFPLTLGTNNTTRLTITSSGNVGIGTSSPTSRPLTIYGTSDTNRGISFRGPAGSGGNIMLEGYDSDDNEYSNFEFVANSGGGYFVFNSGTGTNPNSWTTNAKMVIGTNGRVGISTSSPNARLSLGTGTGTKFLLYDGGFTGSGGNGYFAGFAIDSPSANDTTLLAHHQGALVFGRYTNANDTSAITERMRITSGGNVLVGGTDVANLGTTNRLGAFRTDSAGEVYLQLASTGNTVVNHAFFYNSTGLGGYIRTSSGTIAFVNGSDYRMKTNISSLENGLDSILKLKPSKYEYISNEGELYEGFIAHELQEVIPSAVVGEKDAVNEDGTPNYQGVDTVKIIPYLVKAIQELSAKVTALENK